ncbi:hypothetical protein [Chitinophaga sp. YIM B06452]|uniref:hypothetical protein n=1 Tax=Chitinophaga sp. YIM B06452 TaxID=3082158 RepID=UPI0031FE4830
MDGTDTSIELTASERQYLLGQHRTDRENLQRSIQDAEEKIEALRSSILHAQQRLQATEQSIGYLESFQPVYVDIMSTGWAEKTKELLIQELAKKPVPMSIVEILAMLQLDGDPPERLLALRNGVLLILQQHPDRFTMVHLPETGDDKPRYILRDDEG